MQLSNYLAYLALDKAAFHLTIFRNTLVLSAQPYQRQLAMHITENVSKEGVMESLGRVRVEGFKVVEAVDVGALVMGGAELGGRGVNLGGGNRVAPVPEHLKESLPGQVVVVALGAALVDIAAHAPRPRMSIRHHRSWAVDLHALAAMLSPSEVGWEAFCTDFGVVASLAACERMTWRE